MNRNRIWALIALLALPAPLLAAMIVGNVRRNGDQALITSGTVFVLNAADFSEAGSSPLNENGQYLVAALAAGNYVVVATAPGYAGEIYENVPCTSDTNCDLEAATIVNVTAVQLKQIDFGLDQLGSIAGTVRRSDSNALVPGVTVAAYAGGPDPVAIATTDANGAYQVFVDDGTYSIRTRNTPALFDEIFDNVPCNITGCNEGAATQVQVQNRANVTGKNFVLAPGSAVSGHVTRSNGQPIDEFPFIEFADSQGNVVATAQVAFDGSWQLPVAASTGAWRARTVLAQGTRYFPKLYAGIGCDGPGQDQCDLTKGTPIQVTVPNPVSDVDFALVRRTARLTGHITELDGGQTLIDAPITAYRADTFELVNGSSTIGGTPFLLELDPGRYVLYAGSVPAPKPAPAAGATSKHESTGALLGEVYPGLQCFDAPPNCTSPATVLELSSDQDLEDVDFALAPAAHVSVTLRNEDTSALMDGQVKILHPGTITPVFDLVLTPAAKEIEILNGGSLRMAGTAFNCGAQGNKACRGERNDGTPCIGLACDLTIGTPIAVTKGADAGSVEFLLQTGRRAGGVVRDAGTQAGIPDVKVEFSIGDIQVAETTTAADGSYEVGGLFVGPYFARTRAPTGYLDELYQELPCPPGNCTFSTGVSFIPPADTGQVLGGIDFTLAPGGSIRGTVRNALTLQFLADVQVSVFNDSGVPVANATSIFGGSYATQALPPGNYFLYAGRSGYASELYSELACPNNVCTPLSGTAVAVVAANDTPGIDFSLTLDAANVPARRTIFLNRCSGGCTVTPGFNNSINNTSSIVGGQIRNLAGYGGSNADFDTFVACMKDMYAPFNVDVTTVDPGTVSHTEAMITQQASEIGQPASVAGVSPWTCGDIRNAIVFAFAAANNGPQQLCETVAQELGHSFGLDHEYLCPDPMTYLEGCGAKHYQDVDAPCGEGVPRQCVCGSDTQNSYRRLLLTLGQSPAIFVDGFEGTPAARDGVDAKVFGAPLNCGSVFDPGPLDYGDDPRRPSDRR